jgi:hypothetical protein
VRISWLIKVTDLQYVVDKVPKIDIVITFPPPLALHNP